MDVTKLTIDDIEDIRSEKNVLNEIGFKKRPEFKKLLSLIPPKNQDAFFQLEQPFIVKDNYLQALRNAELISVEVHQALKTDLFLGIVKKTIDIIAPPIEETKANNNTTFTNLPISFHAGVNKQKVSNETNEAALVMIDNALVKLNDYKVKNKWGKKYLGGLFKSTGGIERADIYMSHIALASSDLHRAAIIYAILANPKKGKEIKAMIATAFNKEGSIETAKGQLENLLKSMLAPYNITLDKLLTEVIVPLNQKVNELRIIGNSNDITNTKIKYDSYSNELSWFKNLNQKSEQKLV